MPERRRVLQGVLGLLLASVCGRFAVPPSLAAGSGFHLVNGWVLSDADVAALRALAEGAAR